MVAIVIVLLLSGTSPADPSDTVPDREAPVADAGDDITMVLGETITLDGSLSTDDVGVVDWQWSLEYAGVPVTFGGERAMFTFFLTGTYVVTLVVVDGAGGSDSDSIMVTVYG